MNDDPKVTATEDANRDGLAAMAILILAVAFIIFVIVALVV